MPVSNAPSTELKSPGVPIIKQMLMTFASGATLDIRTQMLGLTIFEDIFAPVLQGEITLLDNIGLFDHMPISGNEKLTVQFYSYGYSPDNDNTNFIWRTFDILNVSNVSYPNDYSKKYTLVFASPELKLNEMTKISKAWQNASISKVISSIMTESLLFPSVTNTNPIEYTFRSPFLTSKDVEQDYMNLSLSNAVELFVEKTKYEEPYITLPYMKPFDAIKWLATRAVRNCGGRVPNNVSANFLFFENKRGFQFVSLNTLMENKLGAVPIFYFGDAKENLERPWQMNRIESMHIEDNYNILDNINNGVYSSRLYTYEMSTGLLVEQDFDYLKQFPQNESVDRSSANGKTTDFPTIAVHNGVNPLTTAFESKRMVVPVSHIRGRDNTTAAGSTRFNDASLQVGCETYLQARMSQLSKLTDFRITIVVPGQSEHKVGDIVELDLQQWGYKDGSYDISMSPHRYLSGNYLITSITHQLTNTSYKMIIELAKDSFLCGIGTK